MLMGTAGLGALSEARLSQLYADPKITLYRSKNFRKKFDSLVFNV